MIVATDSDHGALKCQDIHNAAMEAKEQSLKVETAKLEDKMAASRVLAEARAAARVCVPRYREP